MERRRFLVLALVAAGVLAGCGSGGDVVATEVRGRRIRSSDLAKMELFHTTPQEVESLFGAADERDAEGSLVYRSATVERGGGVDKQVAGESVTFHFRNGVLNRICRDR